MAKRFTSTDKWEDPWFRKLPAVLKLFWVFLCDKCDKHGIWKVDMESAVFQIGSEIVEADALSAFNTGKYRVAPMIGGSWFIKDFAEYQYGSFRKSRHPFHRALVQRIDTLPIGYGEGGDTLQEKEYLIKGENSLSITHKTTTTKKEVTIVPIPEKINTPEVAAAWENFRAHRKEIKKALTPRSEVLALRHLEEYSNGQPDTAVKIIEQSIANGWRGIFELKRNGGHNARPKSASFENARRDDPAAVVL